MFTEGTLQEVGALQASKFQTFYIRLTKKDLLSLLNELGVNRIYKIGCRTKEGYVDVETYCAALGSADKKGLLGGLSLSPDAFFKQTLGEDFLLHPKEPFIQLKAATYIEKEGGITLQVLGNDVIFWGIAFSFPLLCMNSKDGVSKNVLTEGPFINVPLFKSLQRWVRKNTRYVTVNGSKTQLRQTICE